MKDNFVTVVAPMEDTPGFKRRHSLRRSHHQNRWQEHRKNDACRTRSKSCAANPAPTSRITLLRPSTGEVKEYKLTRAVINVDMVKDINGKKEFPLGENKIGYVRLVQFGEKTSDDLEVACES